MGNQECNAFSDGWYEKTELKIWDGKPIIPKTSIIPSFPFSGDLDHELTCRRGDGLSERTVALLPQHEVRREIIKPSAYLKALSHERGVFIGEELVHLSRGPVHVIRVGNPVNPDSDEQPHRVIAVPAWLAPAITLVPFAVELEEFLRGKKINAQITLVNLPGNDRSPNSEYGHTMRKTGVLLADFSLNDPLVVKGQKTTWFGWCMGADAVLHAAGTLHRIYEAGSIHKIIMCNPPYDQEAWMQSTNSHLFAVAQGVIGLYKLLPSLFDGIDQNSGLRTFIERLFQQRYQNHEAYAELFKKYPGFMQEVVTRALKVSTRALAASAGSTLAVNGHAIEVFIKELLNRDVHAAILGKNDHAVNSREVLDLMQRLGGIGIEVDDGHAFPMFDPKKAASTVGQLIVNTNRRLP